MTKARAKNCPRLRLKVEVMRQCEKLGANNNFENAGFPLVN